MDALRIVLTIIEVLCSAMLLGVILIQKTKSQGVGLAFGAGMGESLFGAQMGNVLTKTTVYLAVIFLVNTTILAVLGAKAKQDAPESVTSGLPAPVPPPIEATTPGPGTTPMPPPVAPVDTTGVTPPVEGQPIVVGQPGEVETVAPPPVVAPVAPAPAPAPAPETPAPAPE